MAKERRDGMFDVLFSTPKKRLVCSLVFLSFCLELCLSFDLIFAVQVLQSNGFSELLQLQNNNSFFSYFYFSVLSSGILNQDFSILSIFHYLSLFLRAFSLFDWILVSGFVFLLISHRSYLAKVTMCLLGLYFVGQLLVLGGTSFSLIRVMNTNNANMALAWIDTCALILLIGQGIYLILNTLWMYKLIVKEYLPLFH